MEEYVPSITLLMGLTILFCLPMPPSVAVAGVAMVALDIMLHEGHL